MNFIALDAGPLGLLTQRPGVSEADRCREWLAAKTTGGARVFVPEIADYEVRRELIRAGKAKSLKLLDQFLGGREVEYLPITTQVMRSAAQLWAEARNRGQSTADPKALDGDVILAAQVLAVGHPAADLVVATTNVSHLKQFLNAELWTNV